MTVGFGPFTPVPEGTPSAPSVTNERSDSAVSSATMGSFSGAAQGGGGRPLSLRIGTPMRSTPVPMIPGGLCLRAESRSSRPESRSSSVQREEGISLLTRLLPEEVQEAVKRRFRQALETEFERIASKVGLIVALPVTDSSGESWEVDLYLKRQPDEKVLIAYHDTKNGRCLGTGGLCRAYEGVSIYLPGEGGIEAAEADSIAIVKELAPNEDFEEEISEKSEFLVQDIAVFENGGLRVFVQPIAPAVDVHIREGKITTENLKRCFFRIARGISFLHERNLVHTDLKAENFLIRINEEGNPTFGGIGDLREVARTDEKHEFVRTSAATLAPEILRQLATMSTRAYCEFFDEVRTRLAEEFGEVIEPEAIRHKPYPDAILYDRPADIYQLGKAFETITAQFPEISDETGEFVRRMTHTVASERPTIEDVVSFFSL